MEKKATQVTLFEVIGEAMKQKRPDDFEKLLFDVARESILRSKNGVDIGDYQSVINVDTDEVLSVTLRSYTPVSNKKRIEYFESVMRDNGMKFDYGFAVSNRSGRKTVMEIILPDMIIDLGNGDTQEMRLYVTNSFDGKTSVRLDMGFFRHECSNMALMVGSADIEYKTSHTGDANERVDTQFLSYITQQFDKVNNFVQTLATVSFGSQQQLLGFIDSEENTIVSDRDREKIKQCYMNYYANTVKDSVVVPNITFWSLYNAYTHVITHDMNISEMGKMKKFIELSKTFKELLK